jgi:hypothetical protein
VRTEGVYLRILPGVKVRVTGARCAGASARGWPGFAWALAARHQHGRWPIHLVPAAAAQAQEAVSANRARQAGSNWWPR